MRRVFRWFERLLLGLVAVFVLLAVADGIYLATLWPDWGQLAHSGTIPQSSFMRRYEEGRALDRGAPPLRWRPVSLAGMPAHLPRAVLLAEDSRFYQHGGFDLAAIREAFDYNIEKGRLVRGASTITQQTAKNLFLSPAREPLRKWHETVLTLAMEQHLAKARILELYLNVAEFGRGVYGVQAAAEVYWGRSVAELTPLQAAELAATLPSPRKANPATRTPFFRKHAGKIYHLLARELKLPPALEREGPDAEPDFP